MTGLCSQDLSSPQRRKGRKEPYGRFRVKQRAPVREANPRPLSDLRLFGTKKEAAENRLPVLPGKEIRFLETFLYLTRGHGCPKTIFTMAAHFLICLSKSKSLSGSVSKSKLMYGELLKNFLLFFYACTFLAAKKSTKKSVCARLCRKGQKRSLTPMLNFKTPFHWGNLVFGFIFTISKFRWL
ncbi:MAG: hypothetical protein ACOZBW_01155 [Thermodesulfobacteriota bacterium]